MIELACYNGALLRVEAARVFIPGFAWLPEVYATPELLHAKTGEVSDKRWCITDLATGFRLNEPADSLEDAIEAARQVLEQAQVTPELYAQKQQEARAQFAAIRAKR